MTTRLPVGVFFALFTISGFAGLIYESIWSHYLKLFLGHAAYAQTLVLAIFMGGMAVGSWLVSRFTDRIRNLLLGYALAELGIGLLALAFHRVFNAATGWAFDSVLPSLGGAGIDAFKWFLASALILPASVLLGTTFPLMSAGIMRLYPETGGRALSMLYFTNSFGAALGVLASGFWLIDRVGLPGAIFTAGLLNVLLALVVWLLARGLSPATPAFAAASAEPSRAGAAGVARVILLLAFFTGAASFIYEITWIRMLTLGLGASTHSFEVMLAAFILGMSLGAFWIRNRIQRLANDGLWLAGLLVAKAVFAVYAIWVYGGVLEYIRWTMAATARSDGGYTILMASSMLASMAVMLPTAICAGMTLPVATYALTRRGFGEASIGRVYGANTAGCILGAAFATHVGMEALGVKGLTGLGALLDVGVAALVYFAMAGLRGVRGFAPAAIVLALAGAVYFTTEMDLVKMSSGVFRHGVFDDPATTNIKFYRDGKTATISLVERGTIRSIRTNGKADASVQLDDAKPATVDEATMMLAAALPLSMKPGATEIANIGFGSGLTTHTLLGSPQVKVVDSIEIERMMLEGARFFHPRNSRAYEDPRSKLHVEDAKTFFASAGKRYDIIVSEPSNPWISGVSTLFSDEFYTRVKPYLKDDGLFVQWIQAYEINVGLLSSIFQALGRNFGDYALFSARGADLFVIATPARRLPAIGADVFRFPGVAEDMRRLGYREVADLQALQLGSKRSFAPLFAQTGFPVNSDYYPLIDQRGPRARFKRETAEELRRVRDQLTPALQLFEGEVRTSPNQLGEITLNRPLRPEQVLTAVQAISAFMNGERERGQLLPMSFRMQMLAGNALLAGCQGAQREFMEVVSEVVRVSAPYVDKATLDPVFARVRGSACGRQLDEAGRAHLALLEAINARDADAMAAHAEALLGLVPENEMERGQFVMAALAGHIARGRAAEARRILEANERSVAPLIRDSVLMNLLAAQVKAAG